MKHLSRKQAQLTRKLLLVLLKILFSPILVLLYLMMFLSIPYMWLDDLIKEKLYWIIQGESTDFSIRLKTYLDKEHTEDLANKKGE